MAIDGTRRRRWPGKLRGVYFLALAVLMALVVGVPVLASKHEPAPASAVRLPALAAEDSARTFAVYVADYGYHTAIFVEQPANWWLRHADAEPEPGGAFTEYAWGDRRFYMESRYAPWSVFATLFLPTEAVTYVAHHARAPEQLRGLKALHRRDVTAAEMVQLTAQLERWIVRDSDGARTRAFAKAPGYRGRFHRAFGRYSWWQNCNRWTLAQLAVIGASREGTLVVAPAHVMSRLQGFAAVAIHDAAPPPSPNAPPQTATPPSGSMP